MRYVVPTLLLAMSAISVAPASAAQITIDSVLGNTTAIVDRGVLTSRTSEALVRYDINSGALEIHFDNGAVLDADLPRPAKSQTRIAKPLWVQWQSQDGGASTKSSACQGQANALVAAVSLVSSACADGHSASCDSAMDAFQHAVNAYMDCMRRFLQER